MKNIEKSIKIIFMIVIAGVVLYVFRLATVQKLFAGDFSNDSSTKAIVTRLFPQFYTRKKQ